MSIILTKLQLQTTLEKLLRTPNYRGGGGWFGLKNRIILDLCKKEAIPVHAVYKLFITDATKYKAKRGLYDMRLVTETHIDDYLALIAGDKAPRSAKAKAKVPKGPPAGAEFVAAKIDEVPNMEMSLPPTQLPAHVKVSSISPCDISYVPLADPTFVPWGDYDRVKRIIESNRFFPIYISGMSGNGKTMMVEQACAAADREFIRVQITPETDEDDLIGGFRLVNGETVFAKGPATIAAERGSILLIDELDRGSNKIMCLQGVLEGKPFLIKKTGELIRPTRGFNVIATANTNGRGSEDGRYTAAQIIDEAFIERFTATIEQPFADQKIELSIVHKHMDLFGVKDDDFAEKLVAWSATIRKTFQEEGVDELISTRRLCGITNSYSIFKDRRIAIEMCIARFDTDTKTAFMDLYTKIDANIDDEKRRAEDALNQSLAASSMSLNMTTYEPLPSNFTGTPVQTQHITPPIASGQSQPVKPKDSGDPW